MTNFRTLRETERARYLEANVSTYPDAVQRWRRYEDLILAKYGNNTNGLRRVQALDIAWKERDKHHRS